MGQDYILLIVIHKKYLLINSCLTLVKNKEKKGKIKGKMALYEQW